LIFTLEFLLTNRSKNILESFGILVSVDQHVYCLDLLARQFYETWQSASMIPIIVCDQYRANFLWLLAEPINNRTALWTYVDNYKAPIRKSSNGTVALTDIPKIED